MLFNFRNLLKLSSQVINKREFQSSFENKQLLNALFCDFFSNTQKRNIHMSTPRTKGGNELEYRRAQKEAAKKVLVKDFFQGDILLKRKEGYFPTADLPNTCFDGVPFKDLPIIYIQVSRNNTILTLTDQGYPKILRSCGTEGFKNSRKGTNIAAQTAGTALGLRAIKKGYKTVRVVLKGLGPGRIGAVKGIELTGVNIVSITDNTMDYTSLRPRKQRRL